MEQRVSVRLSLLWIVPLCATTATPPADPAKQWTNHGFEIRVVTSDAEDLIRNACGKTHSFDDGSYASCYMSDWAAWVKNRRNVVIPRPERKEFETFLSGAGTLEGPATSYAVFPDGSRHLIWSAVDKFGDALTYLLVDPKKRDLDVIWVQKGRRIKYFGPDTTILRERKVGDWLLTVPFPGNPADPIG